MHTDKTLLDSRLTNGFYLPPGLLPCMAILFNLETGQVEPHNAQ